MPTTAQIIEIRKFPTTDPARRGQIDTHVFFVVDGGPVTHVSIPGDVNDRAVVEKHIREELAKRAQLLGHTFKL